MSRRPVMIAVGGDSGSGKATLCRGLELVFGSERFATVCLDDYHSLDRRQRQAVCLTAVDPRANNFAAMEEDLWALREGRSIDKPAYDHRSGTFAPATPLQSKSVIVVYGLFPLYTRALRSLFDVTVWLDPEAELREAWKVGRDTISRGYTKDEVLAEMQRRAPDVARYVAPQASFADLTVSFYRPRGWTHEEGSARLSARIRKGGRFRALDYAEFESPSTSIRLLDGTGTHGYPETVIELDGHIEPHVAELVEERLWLHIDAHVHRRPQGLGEFSDELGHTEKSHSLALAQLLIARRVVLIEEELLLST